jgi:hypothetical protein
MSRDPEAVLKNTHGVNKYTRASYSLTTKFRVRVSNLDKPVHIMPNKFVVLLPNMDYNACEDMYRFSNLINT